MRVVQDTYEKKCAAGVMEEFKVNQGSFLTLLLLVTVRERLTGEIRLEPPLNMMFAHRNPRRFQRHTVQEWEEGI